LSRDQRHYEDFDVERGEARADLVDIHDCHLSKRNGVTPPIPVLAPDPFPPSGTCFARCRLRKVVNMVRMRFLMVENENRGCTCSAGGLLRSEGCHRSFRFLSPLHFPGVVPILARIRSASNRPLICHVEKNLGNWHRLRNAYWNTVCASQRHTNHLLKMI